MEADLFSPKFFSSFFNPHSPPVGGNFSISLLVRPGNFSNKGKFYFIFHCALFQHFVFTHLSFGL